MITKFIKTNKTKDEFVSVKNKYFTVKKSEMHETICIKRLKYEKVFLKESALIKLNDERNIDYKNKFALVTSINTCLSPGFIGQKSYDVILDGKTKTIMGYHIDSVLNGI